jgi:REP element-mobilizing transposase RayT
MAGGAMLTILENTVYRTHLTDCHSGFRAYSRKLLTTVPFLLNSDDFVFDSQMIAQAVHFGFEIQEMKVAPDHVHLFLGFPPRYSIAHVVGVLKSISASEVFEEFPEVKKELWGGEFWEDGYFVRTVGDKVTADLIKRYIKYHHDETYGKHQPHKGNGVNAET